MKCKNPKCDLASGHAGKCRLVNLFNVTAVTTQPPRCNHCVTKDKRIAELEAELASALKRVDEWAKISVEIDQNHKKKAKRDRAAYMKKYRADHKPLGIPYG